MINISSYQFDAAALKNVIQAVDLSEVHRATCDEYALLYGRCETLIDTVDASRFLAVICGYRLRPDELNSPFETAMGGTSETTFGWSQITDQQLEAIVEITSGIADPELKARLADLVWLRRRKHEFGRIAAVAYADSAERLIKAKDIIGEKERLFRAIDLAAQIDRKGQLLKDAVNRITSIAQSEDLINCSLANCLDALVRSRAADGVALQCVARNRAMKIADEEPNPRWERRFWELAASFASQFHDADLERQVLIEVAKTFELEAAHSPMHSVKAHFLECALHQYRKVSGAEDERSRVHSEFLEAQSQLRHEMIPIADESVDITKLVEMSRGRMTGKDKMRALAELVFASRWLEEEYMRDQASDQIKTYPLQCLFSSVKFSSSWKTAARAPGSDINTMEISEEYLHPKMCEQYKFFIPITVSGAIEPMRDELLIAHNLLLDDVASFISCSPFVPHGREPLFTIGIHAGLHGRFVESLHILIPQLENLLRCIHSQNGIVTSTLNQDGIQDEFDLNRLLRMSESGDLLGRDLCFALRVIFTERWGYNFRNEMSHGMLSATAFFSHPAVYAWWLIFRMVCGPLASAIIEQDRQLDEVSSAVES